MADLAKEESAKEVENIILNSGVKFRSYSTLGLRDDAEFLFWFASESIDEIQDVMSKLTSRYLENTLHRHTFIFPVQDLLHMPKKEHHHHL